MPTVAGFIDSLRDAFGADLINASLRAGMNGQQTFCAREGGHEIGTPFDPLGDRLVTLDQMHLGPLDLSRALEESEKACRSKSK